MERNAVIVGGLAGLNLVAVVVTQIATATIPDVLATTLAVLIGAVAGVTVPRKSNNA